MAWVSTLPYSGHAAVREPNGEWLVREGAFGEARSISLATADSGVHAVIDTLNGLTVLRAASGAEIPLPDMSAASRRSIAASDDGRVHVLLETSVAESCTSACASTVLYRQGVARTSSQPQAVVPEPIALGEVSASAIDVSARADGSVAFLFSIDGVEQVLSSEGTSTVLDLDDYGHALALALDGDGSFHVLVRDDRSNYVVLSGAADSELHVSAEFERPTPDCPTAVHEGDTCEWDTTQYGSVTLLESDEAAYLLARVSRTTGTAEYRCDFPVDTPNGAAACGWRIDRDPVVSLFIMRLGPGEPSDPVMVPAPDLPVPWRLDGVATGRNLHLIILEQPTPYGSGCAASEVEIDCGGL